MLSELSFRSLIDHLGRAEATKDLEGVTLQLNPVAWMDNLWYDNIWDHNAHFLIDGKTFGFKVVNPQETIPVYDCSNYRMCFVDGSYKKVSSIIENELIKEKLTRLYDKPNCIHALGAIKKRAGGYRIITDCSKPEDLAVNKYMDNVFQNFSYINYDDIVPVVQQGSYLSTIDLKSAYRSVAVHPTNRKYFGMR